ncbi:MAG: hypothetical protein AAFR61_11235 [Bacteroidota bacterium]
MNERAEQIMESISPPHRTTPDNMDKPYYPETPNRGWKKSFLILLLLSLWAAACFQFQSQYQERQRANFSKQEDKTFDWRPIPYQTHKL